MNKLEAEQHREGRRLLDTPYFTVADVRQLVEAFKKDGVDAESIRFTFGQRIDLSGAPWQLYGLAEKHHETSGACG